MQFSFTIDENDAGKRLDAYLASHDELDISRSYAKELIANENILLNEKKSKGSYKLKEKDQIKIDLPEAKELEIAAEDIPLDIIYEDEELFVINKAINMPVHPAPGLYSGTLVNALKFYIQKNNISLSSINGVLRPGIVHRLDKDTSGLILVAKTNEAHQSLQKQIQEKTCKRIYQAIVHSFFKEKSGKVEKAIGRHPKNRFKMDVLDDPERSRYALTYYEILESLSFKERNYSLVQCSLATGRTHQIRVHMAHIHHPIVGDFTYGASKNPFNAERPMLHAHKISFKHPKTDQEMSFTSELPDDFAKILKILQG